MYTFAHPLEDVLENITHSICTLEFEDQRAFYNWATERSIPVTRAPLFGLAVEFLNDLINAPEERKKNSLKLPSNSNGSLVRTEKSRKFSPFLIRLKKN